MSSDETSNNSKIWGWAIGAAVIAFLVLKFIVAYGFGASLLLAVLIGVLVAILLWIGLSRDTDTGSAAHPAARPEVGNVASGTMATGATGIAAPPNVTEAPAGDPMVENMPAEKPREQAPPKAAPPKPKAAEPKPKTAAKTSAKPASTSTEAAPRPRAAKPAPKAAKPAQKAAKPAPAAAKPVASDGKPEMLSAARTGGPDDLKMIKGVGPKLESELHRMGVYHFDQVAAWRKKEVEWMDENLEGVRGRVSRDDWVKQATILAKGGTTEFSTRVKKGGVY